MHAMRRDRLPLRKTFREVAWYAIFAGLLLLFFDWLLWPAIWPTKPVWARLSLDAGGLALAWFGLRLGKLNKRLGVRPVDGDGPRAP